MKTGQTNQIRHIIFDFDGTIVDSLGVAIQLFNQIAHKYGLSPISSEELDDCAVNLCWKDLRLLKYHLIRYPA